MNRNAPNQTEFVDFYLPSGGHLKASNRWCKLAEMVPWDVVESCYADNLAGTGMGAPAKSGRIAYGALLIKERLGITDEETVLQITENPYLQYFLGLRELLDKALFDPSMMVHFRSRFSEENHQRINSKIIAAATGSEAQQSEEYNDDDDADGSPNNAGKLLVDATCTPADIRYPTDLSLLSEAREKTEAVIDQFHHWMTGQTDHPVKKPRTYRQKARKQYLAVAKQKKPGAKKIRKAVGQRKRPVRCLHRFLQTSIGFYRVGSTAIDFDRILSSFFPVRWEQCGVVVLVAHCRYFFEGVGHIGERVDAMAFAGDDNRVDDRAALSGFG